MKLSEIDPYGGGRGDKKQRQQVDGEGTCVALPTKKLDVAESLDRHWNRVCPRFFHAGHFFVILPYSSFELSHPSKIRQGRHGLLGTLP